MSCGLGLVRVLAVALAALGVAVVSVRAAEEAPPTPCFDLSGEWYVLIQYKDARSEDASITKFRDFAWSVKQGEKELIVEHYPYVIFPEEVEEVRRHAMNNHLPWTPDETTLGALRERVAVSARAMTRESLRGSCDGGFRSETGGATVGGRTLTFSRDWEVRFSPEGVRIVIVDSLSGGIGLEKMDEATVYELDPPAGKDELRGRWREGPRAGTVRLLRARARDIVK